jgi:hypothetical protein
MNAQSPATATDAKPAKSQKNAALIANARQVLHSLQFKQMRHDELYNHNIVVLNKRARMGHDALLLSSYAGEMAEALVSEKGADSPALIATVLDAMITTMSAANVLNLALFDIEAADEDLLGILRGIQAPGNAQVIAISYVIAVGKLAKAVKGLEDMEAVDSRAIIEKSLKSTWMLLLKFWRALTNEKIGEALRKKMYTLEVKNINYGTLPTYDNDYQLGGASE